MSAVRIDLGLEHFATPVSARDSDGNLLAAGFHVEHPDKRGGPEPCRSYIPTKDAPGEVDPAWEVVSREPLTLSPSLACRLCGDHGFILEGRWVPA